MSTPNHEPPRTHLDFVREFVEITGLRPTFDQIYESELLRLADYLSTQPIRPLADRRREFIAHVNWKFRLNAKQLANFYGEAAANGYTFHYHQKVLIQRAFDLGNRPSLVAVMNSRGIPSKIQERALRHFRPVEEGTTLTHLASECTAPSKLRRDKGTRDIEGEIVKAQFSAFMWVSLPPVGMHQFFDPAFEPTEYRESFWEQLHQRSPHLFARENALHVVRLHQQALLGVNEPSHIRDSISHLIEKLTTTINNYGFLAVLVDPIVAEGKRLEWEVAASATLFAEKHRQSKLNKAYFRWERVRDETASHIPQLDVDRAEFDLVNEGLTYRDCFVLVGPEDRVERLLLLFQKNERDETPVPCPTCRSANVQGNSYSSLGVRSWECNNVLCPDRSKYNRGKRYAFRGLAMQQAIDDDRNEIPLESVRRWSRDVITGADEFEVLDMLVRHYSMHGDTVHLHDWPFAQATHLGRHIVHHPLMLSPEPHCFWNGPFFHRYVCRPMSSRSQLVNLGDSDFQVLLGKSAEVLQNFPEGAFDGAVTSPPYYNARDYAQWPNMYCHMHDMLAVNAQVFRTLKAGSLYLYNVFDYFDNENTIAFSAMGQRRMILSAYTVDLFSRIGFRLLGNVVWDKGDIEGKRGFNAGNFSPYYQAPFNCWEHILVFQKPDSASKPEPADFAPIGAVIRQQPVIKMIRGENVHGHTAPFPDAIPELLISRLRRGATVLDPFGGSLTTGRVAERFGLRSVCIEQSEEYCLLGLRMRASTTESRFDSRQLPLL